MNSLQSNDENCNWVEIIEPKWKKTIYVDLSSGHCQWDAPENVSIKKTDKDQWWELYDTKTNRFYYYNAVTEECKWPKPQNVNIVPLAKMQLMRQNTEVGKDDEKAMPLQISVRCGSAQGTPGTWTPTSSNRTTTPNPSANTPPVRTTLPIRHTPKCTVEARLQGFEEQCTVSEASMDSGLPENNSSYDSLDGGPGNNQTDGGKAISSGLSVTESGNSSLASTISERPTALAMGISSLRGTPQSRRIAFPRTNPSYRRPGDSKPNILFSSQRCHRNTGNPGYANLGTPEAGNSVLIVSDDTEPLSPDTHTSRSSGSSTEVAETCCSSQAGLSSAGVVSQPVSLHPSTRESAAIRASKTSSITSNSTTTTEVGMQSTIGVALPPNYPTVPLWLTNNSSVTAPQTEGCGSGYYEAYVPNINEMVFPRPVEMSSPRPVPPPMAQSMSPPTVQQSTTLLFHSPLPGWSSNLFRKNLPPEKLLVWSKESLQKPMLKGTDRALKKEACDAFKYIQIFMMDRKSKHQPKEVCELLVKSGQKYPMLRDEILVQLCRQTTNNPDEMSTSRGWELMCTCLSHFLPSQGLLPYLEGYILRHLHNKPDEKPLPILVQRFALIASEILRPPLLQCQTARQGMVSPPLGRMEHKQTMLYPPTMFGSTLEVIMTLQQGRYPERQLPWILVSLCEEIIRRKGREEERIFSLHCDMNVSNALKVSCIEFWDASGQGYLEKYGKGLFKSSELLNSAHCPATLLKYWIEELALPLIPIPLVTTCIQVAHRPQEATMLVARLPQLNRYCLIYLIRFLQCFTSEDVVNRTKIHLDNLAQLFSIPVFQNSLNYLLPEQIQPGSDPLFELASFLRTLILHLNTSEITELK